LVALTRNVKECALLVLKVVTGVASYEIDSLLSSSPTLEFGDEVARGKLAPILEKLQLVQLRNLL
jgi:hypothetical protein